MAIVSSHALNAVDGTHAGGIIVKFKSLSNERYFFSSIMDSGGRLKEEINPNLIDINEYCELTFYTQDYWNKKGLFDEKNQILNEIIFRFKMINVNSSYHIPIIISPHSYSVWLSGEHE